MSKKLVVLSVVVLLGIGFVFIGGCGKEKAANTESKNLCQAGTQTTCPKTLDCSQKQTTCCVKTKTCPSDCKMECCAAKQKAGACPMESGKISCPKVCPKTTGAI